MSWFRVAALGAHLAGASHGRTRLLALSVGVVAGCAALPFWRRCNKLRNELNCGRLQLARSSNLGAPPSDKDDAA